MLIVTLSVMVLIIVCSLDVCVTFSVLSITDIIDIPLDILS